MKKKIITIMFFLILASFSQVLAQFELVKNGTFDVDSDWTKDVDPTSGNNWTITGGVAHHNSIDNTGSVCELSQTIQLLPGNIYQFTADYVGASGRFAIKGDSQILVPYYSYVNSQQIVLNLEPSSSVGAIYISASQVSGNFTLDNVSIVKISGSNERVISGLQALYNFKEGSGAIVEDESGVGSPLDLRIENINTVNWTPSGLTVTSEGRIKSDNVASKVINTSKATNELTFEAWFLPSNMTQRNIYARMMTLSNDSKTERNIGLMHKGTDYQFNLRTNTTSLNGGVAINGSNVQALTHYVFTRDLNSNAKVYINGTLVHEEQITGDFSTWDNGYFLYLGSEVTDGNYWEGTYYLTAIYSRALNEGEVNQNYAFGVDSDNLPFVLSHPGNQVLLSGQTATLSVSAIGTAPLSYQWKRNGGNISGATSSSYTTPSLNISNNGDLYSCLVTSSDGSLESNTAEITVLVPEERITESMIAQYTFREGGGSLINDVSGVGNAVNLVINTPSSVLWTHNGLEVNAAANIFSSNAASKIYDLCTITNELTIEAWIKPLVVNQSAARIVSYSQDASARNFSLSHGSDQYEGRVRTTTTAISGQPTLSPLGAIDGELQHVVYVFRGDAKALIFVNGVEVARVTIGGDLSNWASTYRLAIANELLDSRPWLGTFNYLAIFDRNISSEEVLHNYNIGPFGLSTLSDPSNMVSTVSEVGKVNVSWSDNSSNEDGFILERGVGEPLVWEVLDTLTTDVTNYLDEGVLEGVSYSYRCKAFNSFTNTFTNYSNISSAVTKIKNPSGLVSLADKVGEITLVWLDNSSAETGFNIERGIGNPISYSVVGTVASNIVTYVDNTVSEGVEYSYRISAFNSLITSEYSNVVKIRSKASFISVPTDLRVELHSVSGHPVLTWVDNAFNELGYVIERSFTTVGASFVVIDTVGADITTYTDKTVQDSTSYLYRVKGYNEDLVSEYSGTTFIGVLVDVETKGGIPSEFGLLQNYPNPFNPSTTITFNIPEASNLSIKIYNSIGQELSTLVNKYYSAGSHDVNFTGIDLPSGIYIYSIAATGVSGKQFVASKKLILLK